jgi:hypothetical protein
MAEAIKRKTPLFLNLSLKYPMRGQKKVVMMLGAAITRPLSIRLNPYPYRSKILRFVKKGMKVE